GMDTVSHVLAREMGISRESMLPPAAELLGFPVVATQAQYLTPARMDDVLEVRTWVARVGRSSLSLRHHIVRLEADGTQTPVAHGREDRVFIGNGPDGIHSRELTPRMREVLASFADSVIETDGLQRPSGRRRDLRRSARTVRHLPRQLLVAPPSRLVQPDSLP